MEVEHQIFSGCWNAPFTTAYDIVDWIVLLHPSGPSLGSFEIFRGIFHVVLHVRLLFGMDVKSCDAEHTIGSQNC